VPDVRGVIPEDAARLLSDVGLVVGREEPVDVETLFEMFGQRFVPGLVVQQAPPPGATLEAGGSVVLRVATEGR
jgi:beta-lactam-binding protein with PASTA domain